MVHSPLEQAFGALLGTLLRLDRIQAGVDKCFGKGVGDIALDLLTTGRLPWQRKALAKPLRRYPGQLRQEFGRRAAAHRLSQAVHYRCQHRRGLSRLGVRMYFLRVPIGLITSTDQR